MTTPEVKEGEEDPQNIINGQEKDTRLTHWSRKRNATWSKFAMKHLTQQTNAIEVRETRAKDFVIFEYPPPSPWQSA